MIRPEDQDKQPLNTIESSHMKSFKISDLKKINEIPSDDPQSWLAKAEDSIDFLRLSSNSDDIVIFAGCSSVLIHGLLAPAANLIAPDGDDLQYKNPPMLDDSWAIQKAWGGGQEHRIYLEAPLSSTSKSFQGGEKLIFRRSFTGVSNAPYSIELSQKLIHSLNLHYMPERTAYCKLDSRGDFEDVIKITQQDKDNAWGSLNLVTIKRKELDTYMALTNTCLVLRFDFTRIGWGSFSDWGEIDRYKRETTDLFYHGGTSGQGSFCNGAFIVRPRVTVDDLVQEWKDAENTVNRSYAKFKIHDRKNDVNVETSCAPGFLSNYFQDSSLPWEISPAFFRPEVLQRFKADSEKYTLEDRSIGCRNAWYLKTYDINEAGQVHTYIGYLADLPYEEQLYWQSFNEWPKASIAARAHKTDLMGNWDETYEPLSKLKHTVALMDRAPPRWWKPRGDSLSDSVRYPATDSTKEWGDEVLALDQFLVEGFLVKPLREIAETQGRTVDKTWGSLRVLQEVLIALESTEEQAKSLVLPFQKLHSLRTEVRGHATTEKKARAELEARTNFGTFRAAFIHLVTDCEKALDQILTRLDVNFEPSP
jgi:hypothetical protein